MIRIIIGNLCTTPKLRTTQSGKQVATFTVAVNHRGAEQPAEFFCISAWNKLGEICANFLDKGKKVAVVGEVSARAYTGKDGEPKCSLDVMANEVEFLTAPQKSDSQNSDAGWEPVGDAEFPF